MFNRLLDRLYDREHLSELYHEAFDGFWDRLWLAAILVAALCVARYETLIVPVQIGVRASRTLVDREQELRDTRERIAEYKAASAYFATPEGKEFARRLLYNETRDRERRAKLVPGTAAGEADALERAKQWAGERREQAGASGRRALKVMKRFGSDQQGPRETEAMTEARVQELLRDELAKQPDAAPATPAAPTQPDPH